MLINLRNALTAGKRLPYDAEVEYLESSGTQWIDTGVAKTTTTAVDCVFSLSATTTSAIFGGRVSAYDKRFALFCLGTYFRFDADTQVTLSISPDTTSIFRIQYDGVTATLTNLTTGTSDSQQVNIGGATSNKIYAFGVNTSGRAGSLSKCRIYSAKFYQNGVLVRDFIPVRKGTVGYLYDRVSRRLFGNAGTGDFVLGQDVVPVEYIESHGTEWIDTGVNGSQNLRTTFDYQLVYSGTAPAQKGLFGYYSNGAKYHLYCSGEATPRFQVGMGNAYINTFNVDVLRHSIEYNNSEVSIDGNAVATFEPYEYPTALTLLLFALRNASGGLYSMTPMKKWRVQMWDDGTPVRSMLPVRVGTEGAMMDVLTRRVYRNAGTGAFTYGNDLKYPIPAS